MIFDFYCLFIYTLTFNKPKGGEDILRLDIENLEDDHGLQDLFY